MSHRVISDAMVLSLSWQAVGRTLPATESLGLMIVDFHWPVQWQWQHIKHSSITTIQRTSVFVCVLLLVVHTCTCKTACTLCVCVCVCVCVTQLTGIWWQFHSLWEGCSEYVRPGLPHTHSYSPHCTPRM